MVSKQQTAENVKLFEAQLAEFDPDDALDFVLASYPQKQDGRLIWLLEGGAAARLVSGADRTVADIDIITLDAAMAKDFAGSKYFDVKTSQKWLQIRGVRATPSNKEALFTEPLALINGQAHIYTVNPYLLAASKLLRFRDQFSRNKDLIDIGLLNIDSQKALQLAQKLDESLA